MYFPIVRSYLPKLKSLMLAHTRREEVALVTDSPYVLMQIRHDLQQAVPGEFLMSQPGQWDGFKIRRHWPLEMLKK